MPPTAPSDDFRNVRLSHPEFDSKFGLRHLPCGIPLADGSHGIFGQSSKIACLPNQCGPVLNPVGCVLDFCSPEEIRESVIRPAAVPVTAFLTVWARPNKRFKDKAMNETVGVLLVFSQRHLKITALFVGLEHTPVHVAHDRPGTTTVTATFAFPARPNRAVVPDAVTRKAVDVSVLNCRLWHSHDMPRDSGVCCGQGRRV